MVDAGKIAMKTTMKTGDFVIVDINEERQSCIKISDTGTLKVGRTFFSMEPFVGAEFGSFYEVSTPGKCLIKRQRVCETAEEDWETVQDVQRNNSNLRDAGKANQALTQEDIQRLRAEGKNGDEIIAALTENSTTFHGKTQYSQEKYKRKKARKYLTFISAIRPTAKTLADFYFAKTPAKTGFLRADSLAILVSLANIGSGGRVLLVDGVGGLVTGAVMERMGGKGSIVNGSLSKNASIDIIRLFNFTNEVLKSRLFASLATLSGFCHEDFAPAVDQAKDAKSSQLIEPDAPARKKQALAADSSTDSQIPEISAQPLSDPPAGGATALTVTDSTADEDMPSTLEASESAGNETSTKQAGCSTAEADGGKLSAEDEERRARFSREHAERLQKLKTLCKQGFQSCIIAAPNAHPTAVVNVVLPLLAPSASFAVFSTALQPLGDCMKELQASKAAVAVQLQESWWRQHQVLPGRTHPHMSMSGTGGYILSGIKVVE